MMIPCGLSGWGRIASLGCEVSSSRILRAVEDRWVAEGFPDEARVWAILGEELPG